MTVLYLDAQRGIIVNSNSNSNSSGVISVSRDGYGRKLWWICPKVVVGMSVSSGKYVRKER